MIYRIIIGAPNATVNQRNSGNNTGIIYHCDWSSSTTDCTMIDLVNQMSFCMRFLFVVDLIN